jgi:hypothetical protein
MTVGELKKKLAKFKDEVIVLHCVVDTPRGAQTLVDDEPNWDDGEPEDTEALEEAYDDYSYSDED